MMDRRLQNAIKELTTGDDEKRRRAMEPFVWATFQSFIRHLYRYLGNEVECEDVLEDVYADIWENPKYLENVSSEHGLLTTVYMYYMRKRLREVYTRRNRRSNLPQEGLFQLVAPESGAIDAMSQMELNEALYRAINKLKARERRAIELWMEGMSNRGIAVEFRTTVGAVKMLKFRAMLKLKKLIQGTYQAD
ncbi:MAG: sigma-70 family RNA polymerase sigma factor [Sedimentisphaerales bacterium]|nr:sigma-70 family RNA polymerase sigma factor [Sedimentisphaerales bacterium]